MVQPNFKVRYDNTIHCTGKKLIKSVVAGFGFIKNLLGEFGTDSEHIMNYDNQIESKMET